MTFTTKQRRALRAKLSHRHIRHKMTQGTSISYLEGWHAISEANRIFGPDCWDRQTRSPRCIWSRAQKGAVECFYSTKVRITVRAGGTITVREGIGTGFGRSTNAEAAHEIALKTAETDATKRALATFGNPFGLALYDKDQTMVTKPKDGQRATSAKTSSGPPLAYNIVHEGKTTSVENLSQLVEAAIGAVRQIETIDELYSFWNSNLATLTEAREDVSGLGPDKVDEIIAELKTRARDIRAAGGENSYAVSSPELMIPKDKRIRCKEHLTFVAQKPCLICGRSPSQAHHLRFAQRRAMSMKVSDEYTVPLCTTHHDDLHRSGDELSWWRRNQIADPLKIAEKLWTASRNPTSNRIRAGELLPPIDEGFPWTELRSSD